MSEVEREPGSTAGAGATIGAAVARGRALFNRADYWDSHEALERAWQVADGAERDLIQGLIKAGAAFHKLVVQDNRVGARRHLEGALASLEAQPAAESRLAMRAFTSQLRAWISRLDEGVALTGSLAGLPRLDWSRHAQSELLRIDAVALHELRIHGRRATVVGVRAGHQTGWGECRMPWGNHGVWQSLTQSLVPALLTEPVAHPAELPIIWAELVSEPLACAGLEAAVWDLWSRRASLSLSESLGLVPVPVPLSGRIRQLDAPQMKRDIAALTADGIGHLILPARPNVDRRVLPELVDDLDTPWSVDLGGAYHRAHAQALVALCELGPSWLADPVADWDQAGAARFRRWLDVPIARSHCLGVAQLESELTLETMDHLLIRPYRCGLTHAMALAETAAEHGVAAGLQSWSATPIGMAAELAFAAHPALSLPADFALVTEAGSQLAIRLDPDGMAEPLNGPGIGLTPEPSWIERHTRRSWQARA